MSTDKWIILTAFVDIGILIVLSYSVYLDMQKMAHNSPY